MLLASVAARADDPPMTIAVRETALAATFDLEFEAALKSSGVGGAVILEQDGKIALRASYGWDDPSKGTSFTMATTVAASVTGLDTKAALSVDDLYAHYRDVAIGSVKDGVDGWIVRMADDGSHVVQISHTGSDGALFAYYCRRPDDGTAFLLVSNSGSAAAEALRNRMLVSLRDYGKMPLTNMH
jgi:hypothetical protein